MSNRTYSIGPCGHKIFFDPGMGGHLNEWWYPKCKKSFKFTPKERRLVVVAYKYGRERGKIEIRNAVKASLNLP